ncbi:universal stress protein [bacterium]|nr:universal stress protein [bacterium]
MKIMVCYDNSKSAQEALKLSLQHAKQFEAKVYLVTSMVGGSKDNVEDHRIAESHLDYGKSLAEKANISCETRLLIRGLESGEDLVKFANENEIDEIIIGIQRTSKVGKLLFGSTAQHVILEARCPVVTVK